MIFNYLLLQTDWNDGRALCGIVRNLGGPAPPYEKLDTDPSAWEHNLQMGKTSINIFSNTFCVGDVK